MSITVHGSGISPFVRKVLVAFEEKGIAYEKDEAAPFPKTPELLERSPLGKIPYMEVDGRFIPDSSAICAFAERTQPSPALYPADATDFAQALWLEEYGDSAVAPLAATPFFQRFVQPNLFQQEPDEARIREAIDTELPPVLDYLSGILGDGEFLVANHYGIADIAVCSPFVNMRIGQEDVDSGRWPKFAAYLERVLARPAFKSAMAGLPKL